MHRFLLPFILFLCAVTSAQNLEYQSLLLEKSLTENAYAVVRANETKISILSPSSMERSYRRVVTVLNAKGNNSVDAYVSYDDGIKIKKLEAVVYDGLGREIKRFKKSDFKDVAAVSNFSLYEDSRVKYLDYTPVQYPYTLEFMYESSTENTAWIPFWRPLEDYNVSTENSTFEVAYAPSVGIRKKEINFSGHTIKEVSSDGMIKYVAEDLSAIGREDLSPTFYAFAPRLMVTAEHFNYEGHSGTIGDWTSLGKWMDESLLRGRDVLPIGTKQIALNLVSGVDDPVEKAKIIYKYVQENTRYISVQVGIGGIRPISATQVDQVKYGDCKGLTNYTKALLEVVGVPSHYTEVHASPTDRLDIDKEFPSLLGQANHVILNIPIEGKDPIWLECTSQTMPFGFLGDFTDDRDVLVITPEGGQIQHTPIYGPHQNTQHISGNCKILEDRSVQVEMEMVSKGIQYDDRYFIEKEERREQLKYIKERMSHVNNMEVEKMDFENDRDSIRFRQVVNFKADGYVSASGQQLIFAPNVLNRNRNVPDNYRDRKLPFEIKRGFEDTDGYTIELPTSHSIKFIPENLHLESKYGAYSMKVEKVNDHLLAYHRTFTIYGGGYPKEEYGAYRDFIKEVAKYDNAKIILTKNQL